MAEDATAHQHAGRKHALHRDISPGLPTHSNTQFVELNLEFSTRYDPSNVSDPNLPLGLQRRPAPCPGVCAHHAARAQSVESTVLLTKALDRFYDLLLFCIFLFSADSSSSLTLSLMRLCRSCRLPRCKCICRRWGRDRLQQQARFSRHTVTHKKHFAVSEEDTAGDAMPFLVQHEATLQQLCRGCLGKCIFCGWLRSRPWERHLRFHLEEQKWRGNVKVGAAAFQN